MASCQGEQRFATSWMITQSLGEGQDFLFLVRHARDREDSIRKCKGVTSDNIFYFCIVNMKPNREKIEAEELVKERLPLTKWELTPKEEEDFTRVMRLIFDAASILRSDLELGEDAILKTLRELADWATN
jgi:hypothetical protein